MDMGINRRHFLGRAFAGAGVAALASSSGARAQTRIARVAGSRVRIGLNAYSFNRPLLSGAMSLEDVVAFCAEHGIAGLDATGYYFHGYPKVPSDEVIYRLKRTAFLNGVELTGTGVRNDFASADEAKRRQDAQMVKDWVDVAAKLGATVLRVFSGPKVPDGQTFDQVLAWMVPLFQECAAYAAKRGVLLGLQNHNDFLKTAAETIRLTDAVGSDWFGVVLDIGSLRQGDPYAEIEKLLPYAFTWQLKENVWLGGKEVATDLVRLKSIVEKGGYRGYLPIETLGQGDPRLLVPEFLKRVRPVFPD